MQLICIYIYKKNMISYIRSLNWVYSFNEWVNSYTESFGILYNLICMYLIFVAVLLSFWLIFILVNHSYNKKTMIEKVIQKYVFSGKNKNKKVLLNVEESDRSTKFVNLVDTQEFTKLEATWSMIPVTFIGVVSVPSVGLEYSISPDVTPLVTVKVVGHQWYWHYEVTTILHPGFIEPSNANLFLESDVYKLFIEDGTNGDFLEKLESLDYTELKKVMDINLVQNEPAFFRLLCLDNKLFLPVNVPVKFIITSTDVLHSFALPSAALKVDAVPGRLSEQVVIFERPGIFWGQCSELCGPYHGFMPIIIEVGSMNNFIEFMLKNEDY